MWLNVSFIITKGFKSTILENENPAVNGGHIAKPITCVSLENHSNNSSLALFRLESYHIIPTLSYFLSWKIPTFSYFSVKIPTFWTIPTA